MNNKVLATGMTGVLMLGGCGAASHENVDSQANTLAEHEVEYIKGLTRDRSEGFTFNGIDPNRLVYLGNLTVAAEGRSHELHSYASGYNHSKAETAAKYYGYAQEYAIDFARLVPRLTLPLLEPHSNKVSGHITSELNITNYPADLILASRKAFTTQFERQDAGIAPDVTFRPDAYPALNDTVSFVSSYSDGQPSIEGAAIEACQASLDITTDSSQTQLLAQETICNSLGLFFSYVMAKYPYQQYVKRAKVYTQYEIADGHRTHLFIFSQSDYDLLKSGKWPKQFSAIRSVE